MFTEDDLEVFDLLKNGFPWRRCNRKNYYEELDNKTFFQRFRLTKPTVLNLVETLEETLENDLVSPVNQILTTLRCYATGAHLSTIADFLVIHTATASRIIKKVSNAIAILSRQHYTNVDSIIQMPTEDDLLEVQREFFNIASFPRVLGCIDGTRAYKNSISGAEWKRVFTLLSKNTRADNEEALRIITIWKMRTPLLSAGIEGTKSVLEALLSDNIFLHTISLLRFCNICAGNNDKQGTFNRTVTKNDLPKWIIEIRHEIAHGDQLCSEFMLKLALEEALKWLKKKYWDVQYEKLSDYVVVPNENLVGTLDTYLRLKINMFKGDMHDYDEASIEKPNHLISKRNKSETDVNGKLDILEEMLKQFFHDNRNMGTKVAEILTSENGLLSTELEETEYYDECIPQDFRNIWSNLLNIVFENGFLFHLVRKLLDVTNNTVQNYIQRKIASLWIDEIFKGLLKLQAITEELESIKEQNSVELDSRTSKIILKTVLSQKNPEYKDCLEFECIEKLNSIEAKSFEEDVLRIPNEYTLNFLKRVMLFNKNKNIDDAVHLVKCFKSTNNAVESGTIFTNDATLGERLYTVDDLYSTLNLKENASSQVAESVHLPQGTRDIKDENVLLRRWKRIKDTSAFKGLPLGVIPGKNRAENPVLVF